jgi:ABC-type antimicrobial peptide transport system permease subunit
MQGRSLRRSAGASPLRQVVDDGTAILRLSAALLLVLGGVALGLAALGVYGLVTQDVAQRMPEIGVRLALGAGPAAVRRVILRRALGLALLGLALGVPASVAVGRAMAGALFGVVRPDLASLALLGASLLAVAALAAWRPARHAAALDPARVLRGD